MWRSRLRSFLAIVLALSGCGTEQKIRLEPVEPAVRARLAPPAVELRAGLGRVAVVALRPPPERTPGPIMTGSGPGAGAGAAMGAGAALGGGATAGSVPGLAVGVALIPLFALGGAIIGAASSHSAAEIAQAQRDLAKALAETDIAGRMRAGLLAATPAEGASLQAVESEATAGFDQLLEIELWSIGFTAEGVYDPDVTTWIFASLRLRRVVDDACLYERLWLYRSAERAYFTLTADGAKLMRADLLTAADQLAGGMRTDLFLATAPTKSKPPKPGHAAPILAPNFISGCPSGGTLIEDD